MGKGRDKKKKNKTDNSTAKNKSKEEQKKYKKLSKKQDEEFEDIDAILAEFKKEQEEMFKVTEETDCDPPSRRVNASLCANPLNTSELIMFGGEFFDGQKVRMFNDFYRYNIDKNRWTRIVSANSPSPRSSHQIAVTSSGLLFLWGGEFVSPNQSNFFHFKDFWYSSSHPSVRPIFTNAKIPSIRTMDLKSNEWEKLELKKRPPPRSGHRMVSWKQFLVLFGGFHDIGVETRYYDDLWLFDTTEYTWKQVETPEPRPCARSGFQFFVKDEVVVLYGGYSKPHAKGKKTTGMTHNDLWHLKMSAADTSLIRWERLKKPRGLAPSVRSGCTMTVFKGKGVMFGGVSDVKESDESIESVCHNDMFQYLVDANKWFSLTLRKPKQPKKYKKPPQKNRNDWSSEDEDSDDGNSTGKDDDFNSERDEMLNTPCARFNAMLTVAKNNLYLFGGVLEDEKKEITLCDFWTLNLDKLDGWTCLFHDELQMAWIGEDSDDDASDDDEDDEDDDDELESVDSTKEESNESPNEVETADKEPKSELQQNDQEIEEDIIHEDPGPEPFVEEKLGEYFLRTTEFWQARALEESDRTGKALRREAFEFAQERYMQMQPQLEELRKLIQHDDADESTKKSTPKVDETLASRYKTR